MTPVVRRLRAVLDRFGPVLRTSAITYLGFLVSVLSAPLLARALGPTGRGHLAAVLVVITVLGWAGYLGLPRAIALTLSETGTVAWRGLGALLALGVINAGLAGVLAPALIGEHASSTLWLRVNAVMLLVAGVSQVGVEMVAISGRLGVYNALRFASLVLPSVAISVAYFMGSLSLGVALGCSTIGVVAATGVGLTIMFSNRAAVRRDADVPWRFALNYWSGTAFDSVGSRGDQLLLATVSGPATLGLYAVATTCASVSGGVSQALNHVAYNRRRSDRRYSRKHIRVTLVASLSLGMAVTIGLYLVGEAFFGAEYRSLWQVVAILVVTQALADQWQWRVYSDSLNLDVSALPVASGVALVVLVIGALVLASFASVSALGMAALSVGFAAMRLLVRGLLLARRSSGDESAGIPGQ